MSPPSAPAPGTLLAGKYLVERVLGEGGMGVVVAAKHTQLDQRVALKFVLPEALKSVDAVERFAREARAAARLKSEHVARVLDVGALENGAPYMVMEYLDGRDLAATIEESGPLAPRDAVDLVLQACEAIAEAHAAGIVHRDLKPKNLFLTTRVDGRPLVKVLDFGISKQSNADGSTSGELSLTRTQTVMGSPNYMSPEALRSAKQVDARSDIWALGVILYESMTGSVPFVAETITQLTAMVLEQRPRPLAELRGDVPESLAAAVMRCLEKDPAKRTASVVDLARAIEPFGSGAGVAERIASVARGGTTLRSVVEGSSVRAVASSTGGSTSIAWGETQLAKGSRKRAAIVGVAAGVLTLIALATVLTFVIRRSTREPAAAAPSAFEAVPTTRQIDLAMPPPPIPSATADVAPTASIAPSASAAATASAAAPARPRHVPPSPAPTHHSLDDLPNERK